MKHNKCHPRPSADGFSLWEAINVGTVSRERVERALIKSPEMGLVQFEDGLTLLMRSISCGQLGAFLALCPCSDPNMISDSGFNALMIAALQTANDRKPYFAELLPVTDLDAGIHDGYGQTAQCLVEYGPNNDGALEMMKAHLEARDLNSAVLDRRSSDTLGKGRCRL